MALVGKIEAVFLQLHFYRVKVATACDRLQKSFRKLLAFSNLGFIVERLLDMAFEAIPD